MDVMVTFFLENPDQFAADLLRQAEEAQQRRESDRVGNHIETQPVGDGGTEWSAQEVAKNGHRWHFKITTEQVIRAAVAVLQGASYLGDGGSRDVQQNLAEAFIYGNAERLGTWTADAVLQRAVYGSVLFPSP